ncbi:hypothetical protein BC826DRAFT_970239 [Russula brevipes]|nr:hypothetical protein BC826DRAFT_970239 [Russula brevipes]
MILRLGQQNDSGPHYLSLTLPVTSSAVLAENHTTERGDFRVPSPRASGLAGLELLSRYLSGGGRLRGPPGGAEEASVVGRGGLAAAAEHFEYCFPTDEEGLVQRLEAQVAQLHACARCCTVGHDLSTWRCTAAWRSLGAAVTRRWRRMITRVSSRVRAACTRTVAVLLGDIGRREYAR